MKQIFSHQEKVSGLSIHVLFGAKDDSDGVLKPHMFGEDVRKNSHTFQSTVPAGKIVSCCRFYGLEFKARIYTLLGTNISHENPWLEDEVFFSQAVSLA